MIFLWLVLQLVGLPLVLLGNLLCSVGRWMGGLERVIEPASICRHRLASPLCPANGFSMIASKRWPTFHDNVDEAFAALRFHQNEEVERFKSRL